mgnify:CR=1 FL=1
MLNFVLIVLFREGLLGLAGRLEVNHLGGISRSDLRDIINRGAFKAVEAEQAEFDAEVVDEGHVDEGVDLAECGMEAYPEFTNK